MIRAADACHEHGARAVYAIAAHGLFVGNADQVLWNDRIEKTIVTDTVPPFRLNADTVKDRLEIVTVTPLFAEAIRCLAENDSIESLLGTTD